MPTGSVFIGHCRTVSQTGKRGSLSKADERKRRYNYAPERLSARAIGLASNTLPQQARLHGAPLKALGAFVMRVWELPDERFDVHNASSIVSANF